MSTFTLKAYSSLNAAFPLGVFAKQVELIKRSVEEVVSLTRVVTNILDTFPVSEGSFPIAEFSISFFKFKQNKIIHSVPQSH